MRDAEQDRHRPTTQAGLAAEALRLSAQGFTSRDLATMLGLTPHAVEAMLRDATRQAGMSRAS